MKSRVLDWKGYVKGEASCHSWKLKRVQVRITDTHYMNNFIDHVMNDNGFIIQNTDKIILFGNGRPIALFPSCSDNLSDVRVYLESVKNTDIHTIVLSLAENAGIFVNSDLIEDVLSELNATTKIEVRFILKD